MLQVPPPHAGPDAAAAAGPQRGEVGDVAVAVGRVLRADQVVEQRPLVEVEVADPVRVEQPQLPGQLEHVVRVAVLAGVVGEVAGDRVRRPEVLGLAVAADGVACARRP